MHRDELLPAAPALLGDEARDIVGAAVAHAGGRLKGLTAKQVQYAPGRSLAVVYDARIQWPKRSRVVTEGVVAMTSVDGPPEGSLPVEADGLQVAVWRLSADPLLPGLAVALAPDGARRLLGAGGGPVSISLRSYRPTRRAVVALTGSEKRFAKVVRPQKLEALVELHRRFTGAGGVPAPTVLGSDSTLGIATLAALPGKSLVDAIASGDDLPTGSTLLALLERIAAVPVDGAARSIRRDARSHAALVASTLPEASERIDVLLDGAGDDRAGESTTTVHGDFYEAQLLMQGGTVSGVLDLDRAGIGAPADDLATMLAHLTALGIHRPALAATATTYALSLWRDFRTVVDADDLRQRIAAVLVSLATGPFRMRRPEWQRETFRYLDAAEAWISADPEAARITPTVRPTVTPTGGNS